MPFTLTWEGEGSVIVPTMFTLSNRVSRFGCGEMILSVGGVMSVAEISRSMNPACFFGSVTTSVFEPRTGETLTIKTAVLVASLGRGASAMALAWLIVTVSFTRRGAPFELPALLHTKNGAPTLVCRVN